MRKFLSLLLALLMLPLPGALAAEKYETLPEGMGVMTSMNAVGPVWAGGCKALLTNILRDEWGFHGAVITDAVVSP